MNLTGKPLVFVQYIYDINVAGTSFIAFHFTAMTKTNKFNGGDFLQVCTSLWEC